MGLLTDYHNWASRYTDAPDIYQLYAGMYLVGVILGDRVWINYAGKKLYPNMWIYFVGYPKVSRKKTVIDLNYKIIKVVEPKRIYPTTIDRWDKFVIDILERDRAGGFWGLNLYSINKSVMRFLGSISSTPTLNYAYCKGREIIISDCAISIMSQFDLHNYFSTMKYRKIFLRKFMPIIWLSEKVVNFKPFPPAPTPQEVGEMGHKMSVLKTITGEVTLTPGSRKLFEDFAIKFNDVWNGNIVMHFVPGMPDIQEHTLKMATIIQISNNQEMIISESAMSAAIILANNMYKSIYDISEKYFGKDKHYDIKKGKDYEENEKTEIV